MFAFALIILLLSLGTAFILQGIDAVASREVARVRSEQQEISVDGDLRAAGESLMSSGGSYLFSGDPALLSNVRKAEAAFDDAARALQDSESTPAGQALLANVQRSARALRETQDRLVRRRSQHDVSEIARQFQAEWLPAREQLSEDLDQLVDYKSSVVEQSSTEIGRQHARAVSWIYALLVTLVLSSIALAWYLGRNLARVFRREAEALETAHNALRARDELVGVVAHDLRSPLGAITARAELLQASAPRVETREQATAINNIAARMSDIIKAMLDVTEIESGRLALTQQPCSAGDLVRGVVELFSTVAASKQVELEQRLPDRPLFVTADCQRVSQVLSNLLGNALKASAKGGRVVLSVEPAERAVVFSITDEGPPFAPDRLAQVFDREWRHESRGTKGTGLALYVAKHIVDAHGGRMWVESGPDLGTSFRFTLRRAATPEDLPTATLRG